MVVDLLRDCMKIVVPTVVVLAVDSDGGSDGSQSCEDDGDFGNSGHGLRGRDVCCNDLGGGGPLH